MISNKDYIYGLLSRAQAFLTVDFDFNYNT